MDKIFLLHMSVCMLLNLSFLPVQSAPLHALVTHLPGFHGIFPSRHFSGYIDVTVNVTIRKKLFYYFVESEGDRKRDPVVLWLNGGPGCSSLDGFVYEHGPFDFEAGNNGSLPTLHLNQYSWSKVASIIYLDSPVGTGFSFYRNSTKYITGDKQTASDALRFLRQWFKQFPEFASNPFYLAGESYAGVFVPTLAEEIVKGNNAGLEPVINLKGYLLGNAVTDNAFDGNALIPFAHGMGLISDDLYQEIVAACNGNYYDPDNQTTNCKDALDKVSQAVDQLNIYNILEPCYHGHGTSRSEKLPASFRELGKQIRSLPVRTRLFGRAWPFRAPVLDGPVVSWPQILSKKKDSAPPCVNDEVATAWLNDEKVRKAIHAAPRYEIGDWELCTDKLEYWHDAGSLIGYHRNLTSRGYRALIYSGDHDMCVPYTGSEAWTRSLEYKIVDEWRPWMSSAGNLAGYLQGYDKNLTFITIKGAGHTVPEYKPQEAFDFFSRWLEGTPI